jgi:uncharacterized protein YwgA
MGRDGQAALSDAVVFFEETLGWRFDVEEFEDRLTMQKLVYFAQECGLDLSYEYNMYRYGPYSPELAEDYYNLSGRGEISAAGSEIDREIFTAIVTDRDPEWLEYAATLYKLKSEFDGTAADFVIRERVTERAANMKEESVERMETIYDELLETLQ